MHRHRRQTTLASALLALCFLTLGARPAHSGAWLREPGGWYAKSSWLLLDTAERRDCEGDAEDVEPFGGRYREQLVFTYVEWGAHERFTLIGAWGYKDARIVDARIPDYGTRSTTDLRLGARIGLARGSWPAALEVAIAIPTYAGTDPTLPVGQREQFLPAGSGEMEEELRLQLGRSLHPLPLYLNLDGGYRARGGRFGDQWVLNAEAGAAGRRLFAKTELRGLLPTGDVCASASAGAVTLQERSWHWATELAWAVGERVWVGVGASRSFAGRNALDGTQWSLSVAWQRPGAGR